MQQNFYKNQANKNISNELIDSKIDEYLEDNWQTVLADIASLIAIESVEDLSCASKGAPFGKGPKDALDVALEIAERLGYLTKDCDGYIGIADLEGDSDKQVGIIGHVDVVPAGPDWNFDPFSLTRKDGYLIGRGIFDDKGPTIIALHAGSFWAQMGIKLESDLRFLIGCNEETGMQDVLWYKKNYPDPDFLFTPDASFPVCYGEKGILNYELSRDIPSDCKLISIDGGMAVNAVPGLAFATVAQNIKKFPNENNIELEAIDINTTKITAHGKSAHASTPDLGINAIGILLKYLIDNKIVEGKLANFLQIIAKICKFYDGRSLEIQCSDEHFDPLSVTCGLIKMQKQNVTQTLDIRYPTSITEEKIKTQLHKIFDSDVKIEKTMHKPVFLVDPKSKPIRALLDAYNDVTKENAKPFTMGGGTYARLFKNAASFGPGKASEEKPDWIGSMHGPDEGVSEELLKQAFRIYVHAIYRLCSSFR